MKISKKHKMYIRNSHGELRNLMNLKPSLFFIIYHEFNVGDAKERYELLNGAATHWTHFRPIDFKLNEFQSKELYEISHIGKETVFYNGGWQPLVNLVAFDYEEKTEKPNWIGTLYESPSEKEIEKEIEKKNFYYKTINISGAGKQTMICLFGKLVFSSLISLKKGWFRVFGIGISWLHHKAEVNFIERIGKKKKIRIGNYKYEFLKATK